jgi:hypothetical protein
MQFIASRRVLVRRLLLALAILAIVWALVIAVTGGFGIELAGVRISSRNFRNPLLIAFIAAGGALTLSGRAYRRILREDLRWWWESARAARHAIGSVWWASWSAAAVVAACGGAGLLVYQWTRARPLWLDEQMIALNIRDRALPELAGPLWLDQAAPLGWLATQRMVAHLIGFDEIGLRFVPVVFGVAAIATAAWVGRRWISGPGAVALVLLSSTGQWVFHYSLELKHYSADIFIGVLLPALVVWALEADDPRQRLRRAGPWWIAAAMGQWWGNGALFVAPACALFLCVALYRLDGWRNATIVALLGVGLLAAFAMHYQLTLRFALENEFLRQYWAVALPPATADATATATWLAGELAPFADRPGGTTLAVLFWTTAFCGFVLERRRGYLYIFAAVPMSAFLLAGMRLVPLYERLSLWAVPAVYVGIALCLDAGVRLARDGRRHAPPAHLGAAILLIAALWVCSDIARRGWRDMQDGRPLDTNHQLDDRTAVRWLVNQLRPGDAVVTVTHSLPAIWWYGSASLLPPAAGGTLPGNTPILQALHIPAAGECDDETLRRALAGHERVLVYFGFGVDAVSPAFDTLLIEELEQMGHLAAFRRFAGTSRVAVVQLDSGGGSAAVSDDKSRHSTHARGCVSVRPAARW